MTSLVDWKPLHEAHAIQQLNISLRFAQAVTDVPWKKILTEARTAANKLDIRVEQPLQSVSFQIVPGAPMPQPGKPDIIGVEFTRLLRPDFFAEKVTFDRTSIRYENWDYTRWVAAKERVEKLIARTLEHYQNAVPLLGLAVEYIDRFDALERNSSPDCSRVIKATSEVLAPKAYKPYGPWHSHCGWFERNDDQIKRLVNADVDVADAAAPPSGDWLRVVQIRTAITDFFNQPGFSPVDVSTLTPEFVADHIDRIHKDLKSYLGEIITAEAATRIELFGRS